MNSGPLVFLGLLAAMVCSWMSFVMAPQIQMGDLQPTNNILIGKSGEIYPHTEPGMAQQGAEIYRAEGCASCHTEQVRAREQGYDISRGWGVRRSTASDYLFENHVMLGSQRVGPDLANAGLRMDTNAVLLRLYEPRALPGNSRSIMPSFRFLFDTHKIAAGPSPDALVIPEPYAPPAGYEVIPKLEARKLAAYILSLHQDGYLFEAPPPASLMMKTNAPAATNAPARK